MIRSRRGLILTGVATFVLGVVVLFPARVVYRWVAPAEVLASGISGTVWSGAAREVSVDGVYLRNLSWVAKPWHIVTGKLTFGVSASPTMGFLESNVSVGLGRAVTFTSLSGSVPLQFITESAINYDVRGDASLKFERIELLDGLPVAADGELQVANLSLSAFGPDSLGGYKADFFTQNNGVAASIEDTDGVVDLAGSLQINPDRSFQFLGQAVAKAETPATLRKLLSAASPANERGQHELRLEGTL